MMQPNPNGKKAEDRARLADDVAAFLQAKGLDEPELVDHTASRWYRDRHKLKEKRVGSRGLPPGHSSTIHPESQRKARPGATPDHNWRGTTKQEQKSFGIASIGLTI